MHLSSSPPGKIGFSFALQLLVIRPQSDKPENTFLGIKVPYLRLILPETFIKTEKDREKPVTIRFFDDIIEWLEALLSPAVYFSVYENKMHEPALKISVIILFPIKQSP